MNQALSALEKLYTEHLEMFFDENDLKPLWFISEAKVRAGRNGAIVSEDDHVLISHFLDVVKENIDKEKQALTSQSEGDAAMQDDIQNIRDAIYHSKRPNGAAASLDRVVTMRNKINVPGVERYKVVEVFCICGRTIKVEGPADLSAEKPAQPDPHEEIASDLPPSIVHKENSVSPAVHKPAQAEDIPGLQEALDALEYLTRDGDCNDEGIAAIRTIRTRLTRYSRLNATDHLVQDGHMGRSAEEAVSDSLKRSKAGSIPPGCAKRYSKAVVPDGHALVPLDIDGIRAMDIAVQMKGKWTKIRDNFGVKERDTEKVKRIYKAMVKAALEEMGEK